MKKKEKNKREIEESEKEKRMEWKNGIKRKEGSLGREDVIIKEIHVPLGQQNVKFFSISLSKKRFDRIIVSTATSVLKYLFVSRF